MIKGTADHSDDFWRLEYDDDYRYCLLVCSVYRICSDCNVTIRNIKITTADGRLLALSPNGLSYDGGKNIFIIDFRKSMLFTCC